MFKKIIFTKKLPDYVINNIQNKNYTPTLIQVVQKTNKVTKKK